MDEEKVLIDPVVNWHASVGNAAGALAVALRGNSPTLSLKLLTVTLSICARFVHEGGDEESLKHAVEAGEKLRVRAEREKSRAKAGSRDMGALLELEPVAVTFGRLVALFIVFRRAQEPPMTDEFAKWLESEAGDALGEIPETMVAQKVEVAEKEHEIGEEESAVSPLEPAFSCFAKVCCAAGRVSLARAVLGDMLQSGFHPRTRTFTATLALLGKRGDVDGALALRRAMRLCDLKMDEAGCMALLEALVRDVRGESEVKEAEEKEEEEVEVLFGPTTHDLIPVISEVVQVGSLVQAGRIAGYCVGVGRIARDPRVSRSVKEEKGVGYGLPMHVIAVLSEVGMCMPQTSSKVAEAIGNLFRQERLASLGWCVADSIIAMDGRCPPSGRHLRRHDVSPATLSRLASDVETLATKSKSSLQSFTAFQNWLAQNGPFDVIIDGANAGFFNQNHAGGYFSFDQIDKITRHFEDEGRRPLVILHERWFRPGKHHTLHAQDRRIHRKVRTAVRAKDRKQWETTVRTGAMVDEEEEGEQVSVLAEESFLATSKKHSSSSSAAAESEEQESFLATSKKPSAAAESEIPTKQSNPPTKSEPPTKSQTSSPPPTPRELEMQRVIARWEATPGLVYKVPRGNNDDWYWLYAGLTRGGYLLMRHDTPAIPVHLHAGRKRRIRSQSADLGYASDSNAPVASSTRRMGSTPGSDMLPPMAKRIASTPVSEIGGTHPPMAPPSSLKRTTPVSEINHLSGFAQSPIRTGRSPSMDSASVASEAPLSFAPAFDRALRPSVSTPTSAEGRRPASPRGTSTHTSEARVVVITNDLMRDHDFRLLYSAEKEDADALERWKLGHCVSFAVQKPDNTLLFRFPAIFSHKAQMARDGAAWHFPRGESSKWVAIFRENN